ncbi:hypothetical protein DCMF_19735 [Candidatus Formimonas warabiya]|uniref:DUF998 domain-containing protein n=1 Tax=Formimonas warabiya TaxID=1761012 RepID=A0A3G1L1T8_FORW1|nr:hypothetical protein DCMF_19735 [Candidatus Formimonas warabiya]
MCFLAPLVGEYLLGNISIQDIWALPFLAPMYGGGALLIRETTRRTGRGWPTIIFLGLAYGLIEAGLIDQSLFNPSFEGHDFQSAAYIPVLGISAYNGLAFLAGHAVWSIGVPIALVETLVPGRSTRPWLGKAGLLITGGLYLLGSVFLFRNIQEEEQFLASAPQLIGAAVVALVLIGIAFALGRRPHPKTGGRTPHSWQVGILSFVISSLFFAASESWMGVAIKLFLLAVITALITRWSRRQGWGPAHRLALAGGALLTYAWGGFILTMLLGRTEIIHFIGNGIFASGAVVLLIIAARRICHIQSENMEL